MDDVRTISAPALLPAIIDSLEVVILLALLLLLLFEADAVVIAADSCTSSARTL